MDEKALTLQHELPRLIEAAKTLEASVLVMLLANVDKEIRKQQPNPSETSEGDKADPA